MNIKPFLLALSVFWLATFSLGFTSLLDDVNEQRIIKERAADQLNITYLKKTIDDLVKIFEDSGKTDPNFEKTKEKINKLSLSKQ